MDRSSKFKIYKHRSTVYYPRLWVLQTPSGKTYWFHDRISAMVNCDIMIENKWYDGIPVPKNYL